MSAALVVAASNNDVAAVRRLLADGADALSARDAEGFTPLTRAVARGHKEVLNVLLSKGGCEQVKASANKVRCGRARDVRASARDVRASARARTHTRRTRGTHSSPTPHAPAAGQDCAALCACSGREDHRAYALVLRRGLDGTRLCGAHGV